MGIFLEGEDSRGDHGLGRLVEFRFKARPGTTSSSITTHTPSGQRNCASWASQPQKSVTLLPCPGGRTTKTTKRTSTECTFSMVYELAWWWLDAPKHVARFIRIMMTKLFVVFRLNIIIFICYFYKKKLSFTRNTNLEKTRALISWIWKGMSGSPRLADHYNELHSAAVIQLNVMLVITTSSLYERCNVTGHVVLLELRLL